MALILNLETATRVCSVAVARDGALLALRESNDAHYSHSEKLTVFIREALEEAGLRAAALDAVAIGKGPGSYTGLRIGTSTAKGICYVLGIPLIGIPTLQAMARHPGLRVAGPAPGTLLCPMLDARRMEVYAAVYDLGGSEVKRAFAAVINERSFNDLLAKGPVIFFGDGAGKCKALLTRENAHFQRDIQPSAAYIAALSEAAFARQHFEDVAYFEPCYLKDFVATVPRSPL